MAVARPKRFQHLRGQWRGAGYEQPHTSADLSGIRGLHVEQPDVHGGYAKKQRGLKAQEFRSRAVVFETLQQAHPEAADQPAVQTISEAMHMKQRQREQEAIRLGDLPAGQQVDGIYGEVMVRENARLSKLRWCRMYR